MDTYDKKARRFRLILENLQDLKLSVRSIDSKLDELYLESARQDERIKQLEAGVSQQKAFTSTLIGAIIVALVSFGISEYQQTKKLESLVAQKIKPPIVEEALVKYLV